MYRNFIDQIHFYNLICLLFHLKHNMFFMLFFLKNNIRYRFCCCCFFHDMLDLLFVLGKIERAITSFYFLLLFIIIILCSVYVKVNDSQRNVYCYVFTYLFIEIVNFKISTFLHFIVTYDAGITTKSSLFKFINYYYFETSCIRNSAIIAQKICDTLYSCKK